MSSVQKEHSALWVKHILIFSMYELGYRAIDSLEKCINDTVKSIDEDGGWDFEHTMFMRGIEGDHDDVVVMVSYKRNAEEDEPYAEDGCLSTALCNHCKAGKRTLEKK